MNRHRLSFDQGEDVLVLAGDIHSQCFHHLFLEHIPARIKIVLIAGNHEYYNGEFHTVNSYLKSLETTFPNLTVLQDSSTKIDGVDFFGGTMFTDFSLAGYNPLAELDAARSIADFRLSKIVDARTGELRRWTTEDHKDCHENFTQNLRSWLKRTEGSDRRVVISHFVPAEQVIHPRWRMSGLNPYFTVDMTKYMGWPGLWLYGHTHDSGDIMVGDTRLVCNPYGYRDGAENLHFNDNLILDI